MHWVPIQKGLPKINLLLADNTIVSGYGEEAMNCLKEGQIIQLERRYFARVDKVGKNEFTLLYLHK